MVAAATRAFNNTIKCGLTNPRKYAAINIDITTTNTCPAFENNPLYNNQPP